MYLNFSLLFFFFDFFFKDPKPSTPFLFVPFTAMVVKKKNGRKGAVFVPSPPPLSVVRFNFRGVGGTGNGEVWTTFYPALVDFSERTWRIFFVTPPKINMEHNNGGLEDDFPFQIGDF